jgi:hypothetical protein
MKVQRGSASDRRFTKQYTVPNHASSVSGGASLVSVFDPIAFLSPPSQKENRCGLRLARSRARDQSVRVRTDEQPGADQIAVLRRHTPEQRWRTAHRLYWSARHHKAAFLRTQNPHWSEAQVQSETRRSFLYAGS